MPKLKYWKHELFCQEFLFDLNKTKAARRAGYKEGKNLWSTAGAIYRLPHVKARIDELLAERASRMEMMADRVLTEYEKIAFATLDDFVSKEKGIVTMEDFANLPDDIKSAVKKIYTTREGLMRIELHDKIEALKALGKHLNLFREDIEGHSNVNTIINIIPASKKDD